MDYTYLVDQSLLSDMTVTVTEIRGSVKRAASAVRYETQPLSDDEIYSWVLNLVTSWWSLPIGMHVADVRAVIYRSTT